MISLYRKFIKRLLDIIFSALALFVLSPVLGITALLVRTKLGSPVIFRQQRPGKDEKIFTMYKFRTMTDERDPDSGELLPDEERLTRFGKTLRSTSLDELPELINIIKPATYTGSPARRCDKVKPLRACICECAMLQ